MQKIINYIVKLIHRILSQFGINEPTRIAFVKYFFNTGWMFAEKVLMLAVAFFVGIYMARYLGPAKYGLLNYSISFVFLFQAFSKLGLDGIITRNIIRYPQQTRSILGSSFVLKSLGSVLCILLIFITIHFSETDSETKILIAIIALSMIFSGFESVQFYFEAKVAAKYNSITNSFAKLTASTVKIYLIIIQSDLIWFALVFSIEIILRNITAIIFYQYLNKDIFRFKFSKKISTEMLRDSWPMIISGIAVMLYLRIDQVMIKQMLDERSTGLYSAAVNLSEIWYFIPVVVSSSVFPAIIDAKNKGKVFYEKRLQQLYNFMSLIAVVITVPIFIFGKDLINLVFGNSFSEAGAVLQIHILSLLFVFMGQASGKWLLAENFVKISMYRTLAGAGVNIAANYFLIKYYDIIGAAYATLLSYIVAGFLFDLFYKKTRISFIMKCKSLNLLYFIKLKS